MLRKTESSLTSLCEPPNLFRAKEMNIGKRDADFQTHEKRGEKGETLLNELCSSKIERSFKPKCKRVCFCFSRKTLSSKFFFPFPRLNIQMQCDLCNAFNLEFIAKPRRTLVFFVQRKFFGALCFFLSKNKATFLFFF